MSDGSKRFKGQIQVYEGSPTGEPIVVTQLAYNSFGAVEYIGEAKHSARDLENKWHINKFEYDSSGNVAAIKTALNSIMPQPVSVSIDTTTLPGYIRIILNSGDLSLVSVGDAVFLKTDNNAIGGSPIKQVVSSSEILIAADGAVVDESNVSIPNDDFTITLNSEEAKPFDKRRWDKRTSYIYR